MLLTDYICDAENIVTKTKWNVYLLIFTNCKSKKEQYYSDYKDLIKQFSYNLLLMIRLYDKVTER